MTDTPVLIVGGGPAGLGAAEELAFHGIPSVIVEPRLAVSDMRPRAKTTSVRTMEHFRRWGISRAIRDAAPLAPSWSDRVVFCESLSGPALTTFSNAFGLGEETLAHSPELGQQIPQPAVERVMREHLAESEFVTFVYGSTLVSLAQNDTHVVATVMDDHGVMSQLTSDYLLGCDGARSAVRASIGVRYSGDSDPRPNFNFLFRSTGIKPGVGDAVQYWIVGGTTPILMGRLDLDDLWWVVAPGVEEGSLNADPRAIVENAVGHEIDFALVATDSWTARMLVADRYRDRRVFLVGDSAHLNPPYGGHGFNTCIGDAVNVGWKLAAVINGWANDSLLNSYEMERRPIAAQVVDLAADNMRYLPTDLVEGSEAAIQLAKASEFHSLGIVLGYRYGDVATKADDFEPSARVGDRLPHLALKDGRALFDLLGPEFTLLIGADFDSRPVRALADELSIPLLVVEAPLEYPWTDGALLVRPDQHISATAHDASSILEALREIATRPAQILNTLTPKEKQS